MPAKELRVTVAVDDVEETVTAVLADGEKTLASLPQYAVQLARRAAMHVRDKHAALAVFEAEGIGRRK